MALLVLVPLLLLVLVGGVLLVAWLLGDAGGVLSWLGGLLDQIAGLVSSVGEITGEGG